MPLTGELDAFRRLVDCNAGSTVLVWYLAPAERVIDLSAIKATASVTRLASAADGVVFLVTPSPDHRANDCP